MSNRCQSDGLCYLDMGPVDNKFAQVQIMLYFFFAVQQCSKLLPVREPEADNFGGGPGTFLKLFFNFMFMIWDSRQQDWQLFWLSFEHCVQAISHCLNSLRPRQNGRNFADDTFKCFFLNEKVWISIKSSLKFVRKGSINNIPALVQIMAWRQPGDKPLSEPMMVSLLTHICVTRPQWVNGLVPTGNKSLIEPKLTQYSLTIWHY